MSGAWAARRADTTRWSSRDGARQRPFYDPLPRLVRRARQFQVGANSTSTARASSPGSRTPTRLRRWSSGSGATRAARYYSDNFLRVFGIPWTRPGRNGSPSSASSSGKNLPRSAEVPDHAVQDSGAARGWIDLAHAIRRGDRDGLCGVPLPRRRRPHRGAEYPRRHRPPTGRHQEGAALHRHLARLRRGEHYALLRDRQRGLPRPHGAGREVRRGAHVARGCAHRRARLQSRRPLALGDPSVQRDRLAGAHPAPLQRGRRREGVRLRLRSLRPRHLARRQHALGVGGRGQRRPVPARVGDRKDPRRGHQAVLGIPLRAVRARELRVHARRKYLYGSGYYTGASNIFRYKSTPAPWRR